MDDLEKIINFCLFVYYTKNYIKSHVKNIAYFV